MSAYLISLARFFFDCTFTIDAVSVVLPWSMCPMVPTFTCGLERTNFSLAMTSSPNGRTFPSPRGHPIEATVEIFLEPSIRIELMTSPLPRGCSTTELAGPTSQTLSGHVPAPRPVPCMRPGAGDGIRTRDVQLGRLTLYQLSYSRDALLLVPDVRQRCGG